MSKSETAPHIPVPSIPEGSKGAPVPDKSDYAGFGHDWVPPATNVGNSSGGFPVDGGSPFAGGNSAGRK